jgi:phospholipase/lecithinase/hemolysin
MNMNTKIDTFFLSAGIFFAALTAGLGQPAITKQPTNQTASLFADASFRVSATGTIPLSYQWRFNDGDLTGMTKTTLTVTNLQRANAGNYKVVVANLSGSVTSQVATLTITPFNSIYAFGFSWTDTHNCDWQPPSQYYKGRACNGPMWPEFLSTNLGLAYVEPNNYAFCGAGPSEILGQVTNFAAPPKPQLSLYCLWLGMNFGAIDQESTWSQSIQSSILINSNAVNRLYAKGARTILIEGQFGDTPGDVRGFGTNTALLSRFHETEARLNTGFLDAMNTFSQTRPDLRLLFVDMFSKFDDVLAHPRTYGFTKATIEVVGDFGDPELSDKTFAGPGADYVFWNDQHGTSKLHELMTAWHLEALTNSILEKLEARIGGGSSNIQMNHLQIGRDYTLQESVDLNKWQDITFFTASAGSNEWTATSSGATAAFYRLKWQP